MKIEKTNYGLEITLPETENTCEFVYQIRVCRTLNGNNKREQKLFAEIEKREKPLLRKLILRLWSMWNVFKNIQDPTPGGDWSKWNELNRMDFNVYYHDEIREMEEQNLELCLEYGAKSKHGYCI